jgi:MFS family permease
MAIRVDPLEIGRSRDDHAGHHHSSSEPTRPLRALLSEPVVRVALAAAVVAQTVMTSMMGIVSLVLHDHGHGWKTVAISLSAHFLGMFGLVLVVGSLVDRIGRGVSLVLGLLVLAAGVLLLLADVELGWVAPAMFLIGVGWNVAFVAATTMLADATEPSERARLLGFSDFAAFSAAAVGSLLAGVVLEARGLGALVGFGAGLALLPVVVFVLRHPERLLGRLAKQA